MQTTIIGRRAEQAAAEYLRQHGYGIIDRNWRRRECEIDIVARKSDSVYLVEVKFRMTDGNGSGIEYIGPSKLRQMAYAARRWVSENDWQGPYTLAAVEVSGRDYEVTAFIDTLYEW